MTRHVSSQSPREQKKNRPRLTVTRYNVKMMEKLQRALERNPSVDLAAVLPADYVSRRTTIGRGEEDHKRSAEEQDTLETVSSAQISGSSKPSPESIEISFPHEFARVIFELSDEAVEVLALQRAELQDGKVLAEALAAMLARSILLCRSRSRTHLWKCGARLVVKCFVPDTAANGMDFTEYTSMLYLQRHLPTIPAPQPHGLIVSGDAAYLLMTYIPGQTLETVWPCLTHQQKSHLQGKLQEIICDMRKQPKPSRAPLGGTQGEGCKDTRRATRVSSTPPTSVPEFWDFVYGRPKGPSSLYTRATQSWLQPSLHESCVFTHGDIRPANVHVLCDNDEYYITGLLDWEKSGFYPESWEACKVTNCMSILDTSDWYLYLPPVVSPASCSRQWLIDHFWDAYIVHQSGLIGKE